jgi:hypothetical protein
VRPTTPTESRFLVTLAVSALIVVACGTAAPSAVPPSSPSPTSQVTASTAESPESTASPEPTPDETEAALPSVGATTFASPNYQYALTLPPGVALVAWHPATRAWDGAGRVQEAGPYIDRTSIAEGGLYIIGSPAESLDEFFTRFEASAPTFHGCPAAEDRVDAAINGVPAIGFTQECGTGDEWARVAIVKDGVGVGASVRTTGGKDVAARDRLIELLDGLEFRPR